MKVYPHMKGDPKDLMNLQGIAGAVVARFPASVPLGLEARRWKGQVPRDVMGARVGARVRRLGWWDRIEVPSRKTHLNDVLHAIGMGLWLVDQGLVKGA